MEDDQNKKTTDQSWGGAKRYAGFWVPACAAFTVLVVLFAVLLTYILATDAQRKRDLDTIAQLQKEAQEQKEAHEPVGNLEILQSILNDRALYGDKLDAESFAKKVFELYKEESGDRYAEYYTKEEYALIKTQMSGQTVGIGISFARENILYGGEEIPAMRVTSLVNGSSAGEAGLAVGEWIIALQNEAGDFVGIDELGGYTNFVYAIQGEEGTPVTLQVLSEGNEEPRAVTCIRRAVENVTVTGRIWETDPSVAVIRISMFAYNTPVQFQSVMEECIAQGATKFVLDVRDNTGGSLLALRAVLSCFLEQDQIVYFENRSHDTQVEIPCAPVVYENSTAGCTVTEEMIGRYRNAGLSFAVLCNENTVSAAELFAAVLAESGVATTVGQTTRGKWVAQTTTEVAFKEFTAYLHFTIYQVCTPGGVSYQETGYRPVQVVEPDPEFATVAVQKLSWQQDLQLQAAVTALQAEQNH